MRSFYNLLKIALLPLFIFSRSFAQGEVPTSWETDFSNPANYGKWVSIDEEANPPEITFN
jgi:hypothetical protein